MLQLTACDIFTYFRILVINACRLVELRNSFCRFSVRSEKYWAERAAKSSEREWSGERWYALWLWLQWLMLARGSAT